MWLGSRARGVSGLRDPPPAGAARLGDEGRRLRALCRRRLRDGAPAHEWACALVGADCTVPLADGRQRRYVNLDNAASTPPLRAVLDAVTDFMPWYSSVHRGAGYKSVVSTHRYEDARSTVARFVGADPREHVVIFGRNTTEAINKLSYRLALAARRRRARLAARAPQQRSAVARTGAGAAHPGRRAGRPSTRSTPTACCANTPAACAWWPSPAARTSPATCRTSIAWRRSRTPPVRASWSTARSSRRIVASRWARSTIPAHLDYLALSAHKMYAPFGTGALIGRRDTFEQGEPEMRGGGTIRFVVDRRSGLGRGARARRSGHAQRGRRDRAGGSDRCPRAHRHGRHRGARSDADRPRAARPGDGTRPARLRRPRSARRSAAPRRHSLRDRRGAARRRSRPVWRQSTPSACATGASAPIRISCTCSDSTTRRGGPCSAGLPPTTTATARASCASASGPATRSTMSTH